MEDDQLSVYEEVIRNSGVWGGTYLNKGRYTNHLPPEQEQPRYFRCTDVFLGNAISVNKVEFRTWYGGGVHTSAHWISSFPPTRRGGYVLN